MNIYALHHQSNCSYSHITQENELYIALRTACNDVQSVRIRLSSRYDDNFEFITMQKLRSDSMYDYYITYINNPPSSISYNFFITEHDNTVYVYDEYGLHEHAHTTKNIEQGLMLPSTTFQYPQVLESHTHRIPSWCDTTVCYQIFIDRFAKSDRISDKYLLPWGSKPTVLGFMGGDLAGITQHVQYLKDLGITAVYFTPLFHARSNHKYDTTNYYAIDPDFGTIVDFGILIETLHTHGIRVMLDIVFNHSGIDFFAFQDVVKYGKASRYYDWFFITADDIAHEYQSIMELEHTQALGERIHEGQSFKKPYETFAHTPYMPKLNTDNSELQAYLLGVTRYWLETFSIDGYRLDVANEVSHDFWRAFRKCVRSYNSDAIIIGEVWHNPTPWLHGDQFDSIMNYPLRQAIIELVGLQKITVAEYIFTINNLLLTNTTQVNRAMLNVLESHDTARIVTLMNGDKAKLMLCYALMFAMPGMPIIYYGSEIGLEGHDDPDCRRCMEWDTEQQDYTLLEEFKSLILLRRHYELLSIGEIALHETDTGLLCVTRLYHDDMVQNVVSLSAIYNISAQPCSLGTFCNAYNLVNHTNLGESLPPYSYAFIENNNKNN